MKIYSNRGRRNIKATNMPAPRRRAIRANVSGNPWEYVEDNKDAYINRWQREYTGQPTTSWDNIWDNVFEEFTRWADDEVSNFVLQDFYDGKIDANDVDSAFEDFIMFLDLNDYDVDYSTEY